MSNSTPQIVLTGGGTGGHLFPGLAVAEMIQRLRPEVRLIVAGTGKPWECEHVAAAGYDYLAIPSRPAPRGWRELSAFLAASFSGYRAAGRFLDRNSVKLVIGLGGYGSVPMARAAISRRIPLILLEQNAIPGRATRWLSPHASLICAAFPQVRQFLPHRSRIEVTGNPIRLAASDCDTKPPSNLPGVDNVGSTDRSKRLLILGGSAGAKKLNETVPHALAALTQEMHDWSVVHQTGDADLRATRARYHELGISATTLAFIKNLPIIMQTAHLAISRAGGTTLAELAVAGLPAILVPYPHARDHHQRRNAGAFAAHGACEIIEEHSGEKDFAARLTQALSRALPDAARSKMATGMRQLARADAAWRVARCALDHLGSRPRSTLGKSPVHAFMNSTRSFLS